MNKMKTLVYIFSFLIILISPFLGEITLSFKNILNSSSTEYIIFWDLRVPRVILAFFVGGILSLGGLLFQTVFKNELITPYTLGIASGTTLFAAIAIVFLPLLPIYISSIAGSIFTILILFFISNKLNKSQMKNSTNSILLIGIALSYFYSSALMMVFYMSNFQENYSIVRFTLGSLDTVGFASSIVVAVVCLVLFAFINFFKNEIRLILISNETAFLKGVDVNKVNLTLLLVASLCVGITISFVGPIGFVGLLIPHIVKLIYKKSAEKLFLPTLFFGGVFLVFADFISRNLSTNSSLPIGVVTAFIGAPFFVYLLVRKKS